MVRVAWVVAEEGVLLASRAVAAGTPTVRVAESGYPGSWRRRGSWAVAPGPAAGRTGVGSSSVSRKRRMYSRGMLSIHFLIGM